MISTARPQFTFSARRFVRSAAAIAAAALLLAGCASSDPDDSDDAPGTDPDTASVEGTWGDPSASGAPYLEFDDDGSVTGTDGCNRITGTWTGTGDAIEFGELASTRMACADVDDWLAGARSATISDTTMTVLGEGEEKLGELSRAADDQEGAIDDETLGRWGSSDDSKPHLTIAGDGSFTGSDGCNRLTGSWTPGADEADEIRFGETVSTAKACPGVDAVLGQLAAASLDDGVLTVLDAKGAELAKLDRAG